MKEAARSSQLALSTLIAVLGIATAPLGALAAPKCTSCSPHEKLKKSSEVEMWRIDTQSDEILRGMEARLAAYQKNAQVYDTLIKQQEQILAEASKIKWSGVAKWVAVVTVDATVTVLDVVSYGAASEAKLAACTGLSVVKKVVRVGGTVVEKYMEKTELGRSMAHIVGHHFVDVDPAEHGMLDPNTLKESIPAWGPGYSLGKTIMAAPQNFAMVVETEQENLQELKNAKQRWLDTIAQLQAQIATAKQQREWARIEEEALLRYSLDHTEDCQPSLR